MKVSATTARSTSTLRLATLILACTTAAAHADYAVFGNHGVSVGQSSTVNGIVASNFDVLVNPFSTFSSLQGGGTLFGGGTGQGSGAFTVTGDTIFNQDVRASSSATFQGTIYAGNTVDLTFAGCTSGPIVAGGNVFQGQSGKTTGNILAGGSFSNQPFSIVSGDVHVNGSIYANGSINGNVSYLGLATVGTFGNIVGTKTVAATTVNPLSFAPVTPAAATSFSSGGANISAGNMVGNPLSPGSYGNVNIPVFGHLYLAPGDYFFNALSLNDATLDLLNVSSSTPTRIFVTGDITESTFSDVTVNGATFANANAALAKYVAIETHGNVITDGSVHLFGNIFTPSGNITLGSFNSLKGSLYSNGQIDIGVSFNLLPPSPIPEPASLALLGLGAAALLSRRRK